MNYNCGTNQINKTKKQINMKKITFLLAVGLCAGSLVAGENPNDKAAKKNAGTNTINKTNAASPWIVQNSGFGTQRGISKINIVSPTIVWATAYDGAVPSRNTLEFTRTTDGGTSWTPGVFMTDTSTYMISSVAPIDGNTCFAVFAPKAGTGGKTMKTIDGGLNWTDVAATSWTGSWADDIGFFDASNGVAIGDPVTNKFIVYTTGDGGVNWVQTPAANIPVMQASEYPVQDYFDIVGNTIWVGTNQGRVFKSIDNGKNWTVTATGLTSYTDVNFKDANTGFAIQKDVTYLVKKTIDGGATWSTVTPTGAFLKNDFDFLPGSGSTWVNVSATLPTGKGSSISTDDCASFTSIDTTLQYTTVRFFDALSGWAGGFSSDGGLYKWDPTAMVSVKEIQTDNVEFSLYPNPSIGNVSLNIENLNSSKSLIEVFDMIGNKIFAGEYNSALTKRVDIHLEKEQAGIYFVRVSVNNKSVTKKVSLVK